MRLPTQIFVRRTAEKSGGEGHYGKGLADAPAGTSPEVEKGQMWPYSKLNVGRVGQRLEQEAQRATMVMAAVTAPPRSSPLTGTPIGLQIDAGYIKTPRRQDGK